MIRFATVGLFSIVFVAACGSDGGKGKDPGSNGRDAGGDAAPSGPPTVTGCDGATLFEVPEDSAVPGPWPVGVKTVTLGTLKVEIWYPAKRGSEEGVPEATYDIRDWLPESEKSKISDAVEGPPQSSGPAYRDIPIDADHGPYPAVIHIHGTASFRVASAPQTIQWASRGFIVAAADHPGLYLADTLAAVSGACTKGTIPQDLGRDVDATIAALSNPSGDLSFLSGAIDMKHLGIAGHSAGASAAAGMSGKPNVRIVMPLATASGAAVSPTLESVLILAGMSDTVIPYASDHTAYDASPAPKRLVGISNTGHLVMSALCGLRNPEGKDLVQVGNEHGICGMNLANFLWDCHPEYISQDEGNQIVNYATTAALEETLHCADRSPEFAGFRAKYPDVGEFLEQK